MLLALISLNGNFISGSHRRTKSLLEILKEDIQFSDSELKFGENQYIQTIKSVAPIQGARLISFGNYEKKIRKNI